jgi:hypothetical protein
LPSTRRNKRRSLKRAKISKAHLLKFFGGIRAHSLDTAQVRKYIAHRQAEQDERRHDQP